MNAFQNIDAILSYLMCVKKNVFVIGKNTLILRLFWDYWVSFSFFCWQIILLKLSNFPLIFVLLFSPCFWKLAICSDGKGDCCRIPSGGIIHHHAQLIYLQPQHLLHKHSLASQLTQAEYTAPPWISSRCNTPGPTGRRNRHLAKTHVKK